MKGKFRTCAVLLVVAGVSGPRARAGAVMEPSNYVDPRIGNVAPFLTHDQITADGTLTLELSEKPNRRWGVQ